MSNELFGRVGSARFLLACTVGVGLLVAIAMIVQMVFLSRIVAQVFLESEGLAGVGHEIAALLAAVAVRAALLWAREVMAQRGAVRVKSELREKLFAHLLRLGPAYAVGERSGELATMVTEGIERLEPYFARYLPQVALSALVPLLVAACILPRDPASAVLLLVTAPVIPVVMILVSSYAEEHTHRQWAALSRLGAHFLDALQGLPTLKAFGRAAEEERMVRASEEFRERTLKVLRYAFLSGLALEFMTAAAIALVAVTLGVSLINGAISFEDALLVLLLAPEFYRPLRELGVHRHAGMEGKAAARRIFEILSTPAPVSAGGCVSRPELAFTTLVTHGANWIALKTENELNARSHRISRSFSLATVALTAIATPVTFWVSPWMLENFLERPYGFVLPLIAVAGLAGMVFFSFREGDRPAFLSSSVYILGMLASSVFAVYPNVLPAMNPRNSLTIHNAAASDYGQAVGLAWWSIGIVLAAIYFAIIYRLFRGKVDGGGY